MGLMDLLQQYAKSSGPPPAEAAQHFDTVAQEASPKSLAQGIAAAFRSDATPSIGQTTATMFSQSNPQQQAGLLNHLSDLTGPGILSSLLGSGASRAGITPQQAAQVQPSQVSQVVQQAEQQHGDSLIEHLSTFYAQHPTLVKSLGVTALGMVMSHMGRQRQV